MRVDTAQQEFGIGEVDSPWALSMKMKEIFRFIAQNLPPGTDQRDGAQHRVRGDQRHAVDARSALDAARSADLHRDEADDARLVRRPRHRHRAAQGRAHRHQALSRHAGVEARASRRAIASSASTTSRRRTCCINDAVSRLRGEPDTKVDDLGAQADARPTRAAKKIVLDARRSCRRTTVDYKMLKGNVGLHQAARNVRRQHRRGAAQGARRAARARA